MAFSVVSGSPPYFGPSHFRKLTGLQTRGPRPPTNYRSQMGPKKTTTERGCFLFGPLSPLDARPLHIRKRWGLFKREFWAVFSLRGSFAQRRRDRYLDVRLVTAILQIYQFGAALFETVGRLLGEKNIAILSPNNLTPQTYHRDRSTTCEILRCQAD